MGADKWRTSITKIEPNKVQIRGYSVHDLIQNVSFTETIYLILKGELPDAKQRQMLDAILVSSVDHGATPPSTLAARTVASTGAAFNSALATGVLSIAEFHGGAIEKCMVFLREAVERKNAERKTTEEIATVMVQEALKNKERLSGYGHRFHRQDPRTHCLIALSRETGYNGEYVAMALAVKESLYREKGITLELNVDGAIASLLCEMDFPPELGNAFFVMARIPGLVAHVYEEQTTQRVMRKIDPVAHYYDGPEDKRI